MATATSTATATATETATTTTAQASATSTSGVVAGVTATAATRGGDSFDNGNDGND
jgi:hypothetical protein